MYEHIQETIPPDVHIVLTEVEMLRPPPRRMFRRVGRRWRQWWTEERLALLAIGLGNACLLGFALWLWWVG